MARTGRPNKGPRDHYMIAIPKAVSDRIRAEAKDSGRTFQDTIVPIICAHYGMPTDLNAYRPLPLPSQEELEIRMTG
jgi:hypothetical protein